ncbi:MAG: hypothetical protein KDD66_14440 [Bdellovibrionales bacterium]|nr:hypothetical protein [Bdellovibrionales bacterium]
MEINPYNAAVPSSQTTAAVYAAKNAAPRLSNTASQPGLTQLPAVPGSTPAPSFFTRIQNGLNTAKAQALEDRASGVGIRQGVAELQNTERSRLLLDLANIILQSREFGGRSPYSVIDTAGMYAQQYTLLDSHRQIAQYLMQELGQTEFTGTAVDAVNTIFQQMTGGAAGTQAGTQILSTVDDFSSSAGPILGAVGAAYSAYQLIDNFGHNTPANGAIQGATVGAYIGTQIMPGLGTAVGGLIGGVAGAISGLFHSGKHPDQKARDAMRDGLAQLGLVSAEHNLTLADGSTYFIGYDGGHRYQNADGTQRAPYDVDFSNPLSPEAVGWAQPLAAVLTGGDEKLRTDLTGYLVNAAQSNANSLADVQRNIQAFLVKINATPEAIAQGLAQLHQAGKLSAEEYAAYLHGFKTLLTSTDSSGRQLAA